MKIYLQVYPFDDCVDQYLQYFLIDRNYSLKADIFCFVKPFRNEKQESLFIQKVRRCFEEIDKE